MLIIIIINIILFGIFHTLSIDFADFHYYGLLAIALVNSIYASRKYRYGRAVAFSALTVILFIATKFLINFLGNYRVLIDAETELPFSIQIISGVTELVVGIIISSVIVLISHLVKKPEINIEEKDTLIDKMGSDE